jgi:hypothetical protein
MFAKMTALRELTLQNNFFAGDVPPMPFLKNW